MPPGAHALLSASSAHRWLECTAAPRFEEQFPPGGSSRYADEGTLAHAFCELYGRKRFSDLGAAEFLEEFNRLTANELYDPEMLDTATQYCDYIAEKSLGFPADPYIVQEVRVDFSEFVPGGFGTCDCCMIGGDLLHIVDYKHGRGVKVSPINNPQMRLYALGALARYGVLYGVKRVSMAIVQPRISHEVQEDELTVEELLTWGREYVAPRAQAAVEGRGTFSPGEHCRWCRGKAQCAARADHYSAFNDFKDCMIESQCTPEDLVSREQADCLGADVPKVLTDDQIGRLLEDAKGLVDWYEDLKAYATATCLKGGDIPGWKVVAGQSRRAIDDTDAAMRILKGAGFTDSQLYNVKPKSLSELEKLVGKKEFDQLVGGHVVKPYGKPTLVPASDKREKYNSAANDFSGLSQEAPPWSL